MPWILAAYPEKVKNRRIMLESYVEGSSAELMLAEALRDVINDRLRLIGKSVTTAKAMLMLRSQRRN